MINKDEFFELSLIYMMNILDKKFFLIKAFHFFSFRNIQQGINKFFNKKSSSSAPPPKSPDTTKRHSRLFEEEVGTPPTGKKSFSRDEEKAPPKLEVAEETPKTSTGTHATTSPSSCLALTAHIAYLGLLINPLKVLLRHQRPCSTRWKSGTGTQYYACPHREFHTLPALLHSQAVLPNTYPRELAWRSGTVRDCHATAQGSIPGGNGAFTEIHVLHKGQ